MRRPVAETACCTCSCRMQRRVSRSSNWVRAATSDLLATLAGLLPADGHWQHAHGSRGHGRSHVLPAFVAPFTVLPVVSGRLALGTWQSVAIVDLNVDNPDRQVRLSLVG